MPESQLDRFAAKIHMGYPTEKRELAILQAASLDPLRDLPTAILGASDLIRLQAATEHVHVSDRVAMYAKRVIDASRNHTDLKVGISTRGGIIWLRMAKAKALLAHRDFVTPDDLRDIAVCCLAHRVVTKSGVDAAHCMRALLAAIAPV